MKGSRSGSRDDPPLKWGLVGITLVALAVFAVGINSPMVTMERFLRAGESYTVVTGVLELFDAGKWYLGIVVGLFSIVFPAAKLFMTLGVLVWPMTRRRRRWTMTRVDRLGKWSMLDVFLVVMFVGALELGILADAHAEYGVYVFGGAILVAMVAAALTLRTMVDSPGKGAKSGTAVSREVDDRLPDHLPLVASGGLLFLLLGVFLPVMEFQKWVLWNESYSLAGGLLRLLEDGEMVLGIGFAILVIVLPVLHHFSMFHLTSDRHLGRRGGQLSGRIDLLERWAMADVFGLVLFVGSLALSDLVDIEARPGLWFYSAGIFCSAYTSWWLRTVQNAEAPAVGS